MATKRMRLLGALALLWGGAALAQVDEVQPPEQPRLVGGAVRTSAVPESVEVERPRPVTSDTYATQQAPFAPNEPIPVRKSFSPELSRSTQNLD